MHPDNGNGHTRALGVNLVHTKFLFVTPRDDEDPTRAAVLAAGRAVARGFVNDFDANDGRASQTLETIQFFVCDHPEACEAGVRSASYVAQVSAKYRERLVEAEAGLRRRLKGFASLRVLDGAVQAPRYTSAEMYEVADKHAVGRQSGETMPNVIVAPMSKTKDWWQLTAMERQSYFYPHRNGGKPTKGHALSAEHGVSTIVRRVYHNPDGYQRPNQFDFVTYFECSDEHLSTFDTIRGALRDQDQNPEWRFVIEGPEWRGRRVWKW